METRIPPNSSGISRNDEKKMCVCFGDNRSAIGMQTKEKQGHSGSSVVLA